MADQPVMALDERGHHVMENGWCIVCEGWHPDAPMSVRFPFPPDPQEGLDSLQVRLYSGANRYDTDDTHVLHLWTGDGQSFDVIWPKGRA